MENFSRVYKYILLVLCFWNCKDLKSGNIYCSKDIKICSCCWEDVLRFICVICCVSCQFRNLTRSPVTLSAFRFTLILPCLTQSEFTGHFNSSKLKLEPKCRISRSIRTISMSDHGVPSIHIWVHIVHIILLFHCCFIVHLYCFNDLLCST